MRVLAGLGTVGVLLLAAGCGQGSPATPTVPASVLQEKFPCVGEFHDGLARVNVGGRPDHVFGNLRIVGGKWGFIDASGHMVIAPQFASVSDFSEGLARVDMEDQKGSLTKSGFIDRNGRWVIESLVSGFFCSGSFSEGLALVHVGEKWGFIDKTGRIAIPAQFDGAGSFSEGLATIYSRDKDRRGYADKTGKVVIEPQFAEAGDFHEGLARVRLKKTGRWYGRGDEWGFIDKTGRLAIEARFNEVADFSGGVARAHSGGELEEWEVHHPPRWKGGEWFLIDRAGRRVEPAAE